MFYQVTDIEIFNAIIEEFRASTSDFNDVWVNDKNIVKLSDKQYRCLKTAGCLSLTEEDRESLVVSSVLLVALVAVVCIMGYSHATGWKPGLNTVEISK